MKAGREHRVPLTDEAVELLRAVPRMDDSPFVFPAARGGQLSDMALSAVMRRMQEAAEDAARKAGEPVERAGWRDPRSGRPAVPHGLRSTFRDWCAERGVDHHLAEIALAHNVGSEVERAYRRSDMFERRRGLMRSWAGRLTGTGGNVVALAAGGQP
jgi:integrase